MSIARTKVHNNVYWKVALEVLVMFHGTFVAISTNNAPWAMFLFGFAAIFFITQIYGINLSKKQILISQLSFLVITIIVYLLPGRSFSDINEVVRIPFIEYLLVFVFVYVIYLPIYLNKYLKVSKWIKRILAGILITLLILMGAMIIFSQNPYQAEPEMYDYRVVDEAVISQVVEDGSSITYIPVGSYTTNIVFIPGGKVVPEAYTYLATELANEGYKVTVIKPLLNLAILSPNQAAKYLEADKVNVVIGHSLGGVVASMVTEKNDEVDMLIMMGSYNIKPITSAKTLTIRAEHDINLDTDAYNEAMTTVTYLTEEYIEDGNHAYFGYYGEQRGDGTATISNKEQQDLVVSLILDYIENNN